MDTSAQPSENRMLAEIDELRSRFPRTQDLYREVCVLLFFRHGITPTANKLYQLVRKGSMSAPTEALNHFWNTLRERSRVTVEHADLPDELRAAAGDMVAALWKSAQTISREALTDIRTEAAAEVEAAKAGETRAQEAHETALRELAEALAQMGTYEELVGQLREELAAAAATKVGLDARLEDLRLQLSDAQSRLDRSRVEYAAEREKLADRTQLAEQRYADMEKRALLEIDHARTLAAKLQKTLEAERTAHATEKEHLRSGLNAAQLTISKLREQLGSLQNAADILNKEREREQAELQSTRSQLEASIRQATTDSVRAEQFRQELDPLRSVSTQAKPGSGHTIDPERSSKKPRKPRGTASEE